MHCGTGANIDLSSETCDYSDIVSRSNNMTVKSTKKKTSYRHVPHCEKPAHLVARRNARERRRVQAVNNAFLRLRKHVPFENNHKRLSKVKTLQSAIDYITNLRHMIEDHDRTIHMSGNCEHRMPLTQYQMYRHDQHTESTDGTNYIWMNENSTSNEEQLVSNQRPTEWPEYGTLGMNEISSLPDV